MMRRAAALLALVLPALLLGACETYNPLRWMGIYGEPANPPTPLTPIVAKVTVRAAWTASVGKSGDFMLRPAVGSGHVYAASADGAFTVLDENNGHVITRVETKRKISGGLEVDEGQVYAGTLKGDLIAFTTAGKVIWDTPVSGEVIAPPAVSRGIVVVRTSDGRLLGVDAKDGKRKWVFQRATPSLLLRSPAGVIAAGGDVVAGYPNGKLLAFDIEDGKLTWEVTVSLPRGATELERIADVAGLPVIDGNSICAAAFQGKVACYDIQSRTMLWARDFSTAHALVTDAKNLYLVDESGAVQALDKKTGASVWKQDKLRYRHITDPVVFDGKVVVGDGFGFIHVLSPDDGALVGRLPLDGKQVVSLVSALSGLLVQTQGGTVASIRFR